MRKQEVQGIVKKAGGRVKEAVGILAGNKKMEQEGARERSQGEVQERIGKARRKVGEAVTKLGKSI